jgi:hypothetical protein
VAAGGAANIVGASLLTPGMTVGAAALSDAPHSSQNASPGSTAAPHDGQVGPAAVGWAASATCAWGKPPLGSIREPHCSQNLFPASFSAPHVGHFIVTPPITIENDE